MRPTDETRYPRSTVHISLGVEPPFLTVRLRGELDLSNVDDLREHTHLDRRDLTTVLLDLGGLTFCDGEGLRALLRFREAHVTRGRRFAATHIHPRVRQVMEICGAVDAFPAASPPVLRQHP